MDEKNVLITTLKRSLRSRVLSMVLENGKTFVISVRGGIVPTVRTYLFEIKRTGHNRNKTVQTRTNDFHNSISYRCYPHALSCAQKRLARIRLEIIED